MIYKKKSPIKILLIAVIMILVNILFLGCRQKNLLKSGVYEVITEENEVKELFGFYKNEPAGIRIDIVDGLGIAFEYEKIENKIEVNEDDFEEFMFHIGSVDDNTKLLIKSEEDGYVIKDGSETKKLKLIDTNVDKIDEYVGKYY